MKKVELTVVTRYITIPSAEDEQPRRLTLYADGEAKAEFFVQYRADAPAFTAQIDLSEYMRQTVTLVYDGDDFACVATDERVRGAEEDLRPLVHFTCDNGWLNDPNGLIYYGGKYHMYYQYNPLGVHWNNMHWGHAESRDLFSWTDCGTALSPDKHGMVYSGSAILDEDNRTGLGEDGVPPILYYYTAEGKSFDICKGQKTTQRLAYSTDGGKTLVKYGAILENICPGNRDPKVVYVEELGQYVMALYLEEDKYALFGSQDLLHFKELQEFSVEGEWECPNLAKVPVEGENTEKWLFFGAKGKYVICSFVGGELSFESEPLCLCHKTAAYAGQVFSGLTRCVGIDWLKSPLYAQSFSQQMSIPYTLSLKRVNGSLAVVKRPVKQIEKISRRVYSGKDVLRQGKFALSLDGVAFGIRLLARKAAGVIVLRIFGNTVTLDSLNNTVECGGCSSPLRSRSALDVRIIVDACSVEVFADGGLYAFAATPRMHYEQNELTIESNERNDINVGVYRLQAAKSN